jgi:Cys-rich repeat protein
MNISKAPGNEWPLLGKDAKHMTQTKNVLFSVLLSSALIACSQETVLIEKSSVSIGPSGGQVVSADGDATLIVDEGALAQTEEIWVQVNRKASRDSLVSPLYEFGPSGLVFEKPVTLMIEVAGDDVVLAFADPARPIPLHNSTRDGDVVQGSLLHFSSYGCFNHGAPCMSDQDCLQGELCDQNVCTTPNNGCVTDADCAQGETCLMGGCHVIDNNTHCQSDSDCQQGEACDAMLLVCVPINTPVSCMSDQDCVMGQICDPQTATCIDNHQNVCQSDQDCPMGEACVNGVCLHNDPFCQTDPDCQPGLSCVNGVCTQPTTCNTDADCPMGQVCDAMTGTCHDNNQHQCQADSDCAMGEVCANGVCTQNNNNQCNTDADCQMGTTCQNGLCAPPTNQCTSDADCAQGEVCNAMSGCCEPINTNPPCMSDQDCAAGQSCDPQTATCVDNNTNQCQVHSDCAMGQQACVNGQCVSATTCQSDQDCAQGEVCDTMQNVCVQ